MKFYQKPKSLVVWIGETWLFFSFQKLWNRLKSGETCLLTWTITRVLQVDRQTCKNHALALVLCTFKNNKSNRFSRYLINAVAFIFYWPDGRLVKLLLSSTLVDKSPLTFIYFTTFEKKRRVRSPLSTQPNFLVFGKYIYILQIVSYTLILYFIIYTECV